MVESKLRERIKELTCLYEIARLAPEANRSQAELFQEVVRLLPAAWQYPDIAEASIAVDDGSYCTPGFARGRERLTAEIIIGGRKRGSVEVAYLERRPAADEGPFLREERHLIDAVARQVASMIARLEAEQERERLYEQLMHADRLATLGVLAAGVAHELNEPLASILGFAQLARKQPGVPRQAAEDLGKIERATLHAREVIRNLLGFARQAPAQEERVDLCDLATRSLAFFEARCAKNGVRLVRSLAPEPVRVVGNPAQLSQVLVNLIVNAVQSMPAGGMLTVATAANPPYASLTIEDTGIGMSQEVMANAFTPFFTTKAPGEGTGLGLPVVQGIVRAHGGTVEVQSAVGVGTRFEVQLPLAAEPDREAD